MWRRRGSERRRSEGSPACFTVVDPGNVTLRVLVVEVRRGQATVWGWHQRPGVRSAAHLTDVFEDALRQAEEMAQARAGRWLLPDQMLMGLPASKLRGGAWPVSQRRSRPEQPIDERELEALLGRALRLTVNRLLGADLNDGGNGPPGWLLVDAAPVALTVDENGVTDPVGFRGREIGGTVFAALAEPETIETWRCVAEDLEFSALTLAAAPLALAAGFPKPQGLLIDVGGATTDLTWCRNGHPVALASLPRGGIDLTRALLRKWRISPDRAERLKIAYGAGRLSDEAKPEILGVLAPVLEDWLQETETALATLNEDEPLPQQLYLLGGGSVLSEVTETARALAWSRKLRFERYPQVERFEPTDVPGVVNRTDAGRSAGDVSALALAAWAARQKEPAGRSARILDEICGS